MDVPAEQPAEQPEESQSSDLGSVGCIALIVLVVVVAAYILLVNNSRITTAVNRIIGGGPTPTPTMTVAEMIEATPDLCPATVAEAQACPRTWPEGEEQLVVDYKARVRPIAADLLEALGKLRSVDQAMRVGRVAAYTDSTWTKAADDAFDIVWGSVANLNNSTPGSIAGTHARLLYAAALMADCQSDYEFYRGVVWAGGQGRIADRAPLNCDLGLAEQEILLALGDLGN